MSFEAQLRGLLHQLSSLLNSSVEPSADASALCQDVRQIILQPNLSTSARAICTDFLLVSQHPPSLLTFVDRASYQQYAKNKTLANARIETTELIRDYMEQYPTSCEFYYGQIQKIFYSVFKRDETSRVRAATFDIFDHLLSVDGGGVPPPPATMNMLRVHNVSSGSIVRPFVNCFRRSSQNLKLSATIRGRSLRLLGKLAAAYPRHMQDEASNVLEFCCGILLKTTGSQMKDTGVETAGSLDGLRYLFREFDHLLLEMDAGTRDDLYKVMFRQALTGLKEMKRYQIPEAALLFVASHGAMFRHQIVREGLELFRRICRCFVCKPKRIHQAAPGAMKRLLNVLSEHIMSHGVDSGSGGSSEGGLKESESEKKSMYKMLMSYLEALMCDGSRATFLVEQAELEDGTVS